MSKLIQVDVKITNADVKTERMFVFFSKMEDNQNDYMKNFLHALKLRTYWMPDAKISQITYHTAGE